MPSARRVRRPPLNCALRDLALAQLYADAPSLRSTVDASLKQFRNCARTLSSLDPSLHAELRVLERLYYKNVNQHRAALFWKRTQEVRRLALRVHEARLLSLVENARAAFYNLELPDDDSTTQNTRKRMNAAWTHVPSVQFLTYVQKRASCALELLERAKERFAGAFHSISIMMQTGAFLQLVLALSAIVARLHSLISAMNDVLHMLCSTVSSMLQVMNCKKAAEKKAKISSKLGEVSEQQKQQPCKDEMGYLGLSIGEGQKLQDAVMKDIGVVEQEGQKDQGEAGEEDTGRVLMREGSRMRAEPDAHLHEQKKQEPRIDLAHSAQQRREEGRHQPMLVDAASESLWPEQSNEADSSSHPNLSSRAVSLTVPASEPSSLHRPASECQPELELGLEEPELKPESGPMPVSKAVSYNAAPILVIPRPESAVRQRLTGNQADDARKNNNKRRLLENEVIDQRLLEVHGVNPMTNEKTGKTSKKRKKKLDEIDEIFGSL